MDQIDTTDALARIWLSDPATLRSALEMDDDDNLSICGSPLEDVADTFPDSDETALEKQRVELRSYIDKLPYSCESLEETDEKLGHIVKMIYIAARSNHLDLLRSWHGALNTWLLMKYPIPKLTRINLLRYFYELCVIPSESHLVQEGVRMFAALLPHKHNSIISIDWRDFVLDWRPLWRIVRKELWPMKRLMQPSRNVVNLYLQLAELSKRFFPSNEVQNIMDIILPLLSPDTFLSIVPVFTCFIPLSRSQEYLPALFSIWEALNSNIVDERMMELMAELAEEHVVGTAESSEDEAAPWKDVGIWTERQWFFITRKCLGAMNVPIGSTKGSSTTGGHADASGMKNSIRIKKPINKNHALAKLFVYSMSLDGPVRTDATYSDPDQNQSGLLAGCKALDSLEKIITSAETCFHPSNSGHWTLNLSSFLQRLASEFCKRWKEEEDNKCKTPVTRRLTPDIRRSFVLLLRTPLLLALFAKDPISMGLVQGALRSMAILEPGLVMPSLLERAFGGLEVVNETHRTTAVLSMLSGMALPLVSQRIWRGGQKHLVPLLDLCLPGIDLNDPTKTICTTLFICSALQHVKISDLSMHAHTVGILTADDSLSEALDGAELGHIPDGAEGIFTILSKEEERTLARESTSGFADWVAALFRRVFALYENLPEEGGRKNTTGGKTEESVLKSIKNMLDVVCLHLSDPLFDLVLKIVFDYATSNAKSNAVRAIGQLVACLARAKPQLTIDKFLPFCARQIKEELKYGASSIRTTSSHAAVPSDTTLHWNISLLRGCLGCGGAVLLKHRDTIIDLLSILIDKTKSERGFTGTGRLISRILHTLSGVYPINSRFVNTNEWESEEFDKNHDLHWGCFTHAKNVEIEWHVPNDDEVSFILQILEQIVSPLLDRIERLLADTGRWTVEVNDFCRYLYAVRSVWSGLPTVILLKEPKRVGDPELKDEHNTLSTLHPSGLLVKAGFILTDDRDPRYQAVKNHRKRFGRTIHQAAVALRGHIDGEDHIDAVLSVLKSVDTYLLEYATSKPAYLALRKNYVMARDLNRMWPRQRENTRLVFLKRAQVYHHARLAAHSTNRCRTEFDVLLFDDLIEYSLSPYTRVRRQSQNVLIAATDTYPLSARYILPKMFSALARGTDPDRMKGALHVLSDRNYRAVIRSDHAIRTELLVSLLECQHQEKPSVQKLIANVHHDIMHHCNSEEVWWKRTACAEDSELYVALESLKSIFSDTGTCASLLNDSLDMVARDNVQKEAAYEVLTTRIVEIAARPATHWRYLQMALQSLPLRRDRPCAPNVAETLFKATTESHPSIRLIAQKGVVKVLSIVKIRSFAKNRGELWFEEWRNPLQKDVSTHGGGDIISILQQSLSSNQTPQLYIDKITSGFLFWEPALKGYYYEDGSSSLSCLWEEQSRSALGVMDMLMNNPTYFPRLLALWSQEADARGALNTDISLRYDNITYVKTIAKMFEEKYLDKLLPEVDSLVTDSNRFSQRAGAETLAGLLRGSKHWSESARKTLWNWFMARVSNIFGQIKPDTSVLWESFFRHILEDRDPGRNKPLVDWILSLPLDFHGDSAFTMMKHLDIFATLVNEMGIRFAGLSSSLIETFFANADTSYAEIRMGIAQCLHLLMGCEWHMNYPSLNAFLKACREQSDPLQIRKAKHARYIHNFVHNFPAWKSERLPPPRVGQSQFDKVSMTLLLWMWSLGHSSEASTMFVYVEPLLPDILKMTELHDNNELAVYSSGVLFVLSAVTPPHEYIEIIVDQFINTMKESASYKIKLIGMPMLALFFFRNLVGISEACTARVMEIVTAYLADENIEVREVAKKVLSGLLRSSQRRKILPLRDQFVRTLQETKFPRRQDPGYADALKAIHSAVLGICALIESFPYSVEPWMPPLTEVLAPHASDPQPISAAIRKTASEFKKTHQDTWHVDQQAFNEHQLQDLSTMLVGTSYYA